jgi:phosphate transport system substrate-binding protein
MAKTFVPEVKYVPLPDAAYAAVQKQFDKKHLGTAFGGHSEIGMSIEKLLQKEKAL